MLRGARQTPRPRSALCRCAALGRRARPHPGAAPRPLRAPGGLWVADSRGVPGPLRASRQVDSSPGARASVLPWGRVAQKALGSFHPRVSGDRLEASRVLARAVCLPTLTGEGGIPEAWAECGREPQPQPRSSAAASRGPAGSSWWFPERQRASTTGHRASRSAGAEPSAAVP